MPTEKSIAPAETTPAPASLEELVKKSIALSETVQAQNRKILHRMTMMAVASYLRLIILVVPLVLAAIFLPPIFRDYVGALQSAFGGENGGNTSALQELLSQFTD